MQSLLDRPKDIVILHDVNRAALIEQIQEARKTLEKLLALLQSAPVERDRFVSHLYQPGGHTGGRAKRLASPASKSSGVSLQASGSPTAWGCKAEFRTTGEYLLRIGD